MPRVRLEYAARIDALVESVEIAPAGAGKD